MLALAALAGLSACEPADRSPSVAAHAREARGISAPGLDRTLLGRRWREAAARALREPTRVVLPHAEQGALLAQRADALGFVFEATAGQILEIGLDRAPVTDSPADDGRIYIDVYRIVPGEARTRYERIGDASLEGSSLGIAIPATADYVVRIQPELLVNTLYGLTLELDAALPFPVDGQTMSAVQSFFGDTRDAGGRQHEGIDIFAERLTPVRAVTDGRAVPRRNELGGNVVWLNAPGRSFYYAHLERPAVDKPRRVKAGDVLGYVGNSGNAAATPPHLHFGIYRWGRGAIDPFPELVARRLTEPPEHAGELEPRLVIEDADRAYVRTAGSTGTPVLAQLPSGTIVSVRAMGDTLPLDLPVDAPIGRPVDLHADDWIERRPVHGVDPRPQEPATEQLLGGTRFALVVPGPGDGAPPIAMPERAMPGRGGSQGAVEASSAPSTVRMGQGFLAGSHGGSP